MSVPGGLVSAPGSSFFGSAKVYSPERREFVSQKHMDLATVISDYDPNFELVFIPEHARDETDTKPFGILHKGTETTRPHIIRYLNERELDDPKAILAWLFMGDQRYHDPKSIIQRIEMEELAERALKLKREQEETEDRIEEMSTIAVGGRDRKHWYKHNGHTFRR